MSGEVLNVDVKASGDRALDAVAKSIRNMNEAMKEASRTATTYDASGRKIAEVLKEMAAGYIEFTRKLALDKDGIFSLKETNIAVDNIKRLRIELNELKKLQQEITREGKNQAKRTRAGEGPERDAIQADRIRRRQQEAAYRQREQQLTLAFERHEKQVTAHKARITNAVGAQFLAESGIFGASDRRIEAGKVKQSMLERAREEAEIQKEMEQYAKAQQQSESARLKANMIARARTADEHERAHFAELEHRYNQHRKMQAERLKLARRMGRDVAIAERERQHAENLALYGDIKGSNVERARREMELAQIKAAKGVQPPGSFASGFTGRLGSRMGDQTMAVFAGTLAAGAVLQGVRALGAALHSAASDAFEFNKQIMLIRSISQGDGEQSIGKWTRSITELSSAFGRTREEVAAGTYEVLSNQIAKGADATKFMADALKLSLVGGISASGAVDALSSAINSYNTGTERATEISAAFFKAQDLGRFKIGDIANTLGRTTFTASQVGVSLNEVLAALATITRSGLPAHEAMTLINNVMLQMMKPSESLKELFGEWGVATGQLAIQTFGFGGVLERLSQAVRGNAHEVAELFPEMRAMRGTFALAAEGGLAFNDALGKISGSSGAFNEALKDIRNSAHQLMSEDWQYLKNQLNEVADAFVDFYAAVRGPKLKTEQDFKDEQRAADQAAKTKIVDEIEKQNSEILQAQAIRDADANKRRKAEIEAITQQTEEIKSKIRTRHEQLNDIIKGYDAKARELLRSGEPNIADNRGRTDARNTYERKIQFLEAFGMSDADMLANGNPLKSLYSRLGFSGTASDRISELKSSAGRSLASGNVEGFKRDLSDIDGILKSIYESQLKAAALAYQQGDALGFSTARKELIRVNEALKANQSASRRQEDAVAASNAVKAAELERKAEAARAVMYEVEKGEKRLYALKPETFKSQAEALAQFDNVAAGIFGNAGQIDPELAVKLNENIAELRGVFSGQVRNAIAAEEATQLKVALTTETNKVVTSIQETGQANTDKLEEIRAVLAGEAPKSGQNLVAAAAAVAKVQNQRPAADIAAALDVLGRSGNNPIAASIRTLGAVAGMPHPTGTAMPPIGGYGSSMSVPTATSKDFKSGSFSGMKFDPDWNLGYDAAVAPIRAARDIFQWGLEQLPFGYGKQFKGERVNRERGKGGSGGNGGGAGGGGGGMYGPPDLFGDANLGFVRGLDLPSVRSKGVPFSYYPSDLMSGSRITPPEMFGPPHLLGPWGFNGVPTASAAPLSSYAPFDLSGFGGVAAYSRGLESGRPTGYGQFARGYNPWSGIDQGVQYGRSAVPSANFNPNVGRGYVPRPGYNAPSNDGLVAPNIGAVNITVDGSKTPQATAERVMVEIQRVRRTGVRSVVYGTNGN